MFLKKKHWQSYKSMFHCFLSDGRSRYGRIWHSSRNRNCTGSSVFCSSWKRTSRTTRLNKRNSSFTVFFMYPTSLCCPSLTSQLEISAWHSSFSCNIFHNIGILNNQQMALKLVIFALLGDHLELLPF